MEGAVEGAHMGHPDFRVNARIFATIHPDQQFGMVKLTGAGCLCDEVAGRAAHSEA